MKKLLILLMIGLVGGSSLWASAHGGRTDSQGCHNDRKAGTRHCH